MSVSRASLRNLVQGASAIASDTERDDEDQQSVDPVETGPHHARDPDRSNAQPETGEQKRRPWTVADGEGDVASSPVLIDLVDLCEGKQTDRNT